MKAERDRLRRALDKAARVLHSDALIQQHQIAALHGFPYLGEAFTKEDYEKAIEGQDKNGDVSFDCLDHGIGEP